MERSVHRPTSTSGPTPSWRSRVASWFDRAYRTPRRDFSTRWNFYDTIGVGHSFGAQHQHELGIRWVHVSNAGIKEPNPGQDFLQLRYAVRV